MDILTLSTYKEYMGINSDTKDVAISHAIAAANSFIPSYCNRTFNAYYDTDKVELFDATQPDYFPKEFPIISVTSVKTSSSEDGVYDTTLTAFTDYIVDYESSRIVAIGADYFAAATTSINSGELTYKGGYECIPIDIEQAAVLLTEYFISQDYVPRKSLAGASKDSVIIPDLTARLPAHIRRILEHHRAMVL